jgi:hypothetical protein
MLVEAVAALNLELLHLVAQVELVVVAMVHLILLRVRLQVQRIQVVAVAVLQVLIQQAALAAPVSSS